MKFSCPNCSQHLEAGEEWIGHSMACPACGKSFEVKAPAEAGSPLPPPKPATPPPGAPPANVPRPHIPGPMTPQTPRPTSRYVPPRRKRGGGFGKMLVVLLLVLAGCVGYEMYKYKESPQQFWQRLADFVESLLKPAPAPVVESSTPPPATPQPSATPRPVATPPPAIDAIAWLAQHRNYWPKEIILLQETTFPAVYQGKVAGSVQVPAGTAVQLFDITGGTVGVVYNGGGARVAIDATDLRSRAGVAMVAAAADEARAAQAAAAASAAAAANAAVAQSSSPGMGGQTFPVAGNRIPETISGEVRTEDDLTRRQILLSGTSELHLTGTGGLLEGTVINFKSPDAWLFFDRITPGDVVSSYLGQLWVYGVQAEADKNVRVVQYGPGTVVIPQGEDFPPMTVYSGESFAGTSMPLQCYTKYNDAALGAMKSAIHSFRLKRGYEATIAQNEDGTGISKNYVADGGDIEVPSLGSGLGGSIRFVRIFPWRWVSKKGVAGGIWQNLNVGWYYNWNISDRSTQDIEYVPIKQKRGWPSLDQDWKDLGASNLLGFNEPDHKDQSNMKVDDAIAGWPELLGTGLRVGSPAPSDGGLGWLYDFIAKADEAHLRVDFVAVHYYRAVAGNNAQSAANSLYNFLKGVHDHTKRPIWVTEWNNGANWTGNDPTYSQEKAAIAAMIKMMDRTPWIERYAIYNWVKDVRNVQRKDGSLTPAGEVYRDEVSPVAPVHSREW